MATTKTAAEVERMQDDPRVREARAKLLEVSGKLDQVAAAISNEMARWARHRASLGDLAKHADEANAMVYGPTEKSGRGTATIAPPPSVDLVRLEKERDVLTVAYQMASERVREAEATVSAEIVGRARPRYIDLVRRQVAAAQALAQVVEEEEAFVADLHASAGGLAGLQRVIWPGVDKFVLARFRETAARFHGASF